MQFVSHDDLRPAMTGIYLSFEDYKCKVVATNAHLCIIQNNILYFLADEYGKPFEEYGIIISPSAFKKVLAQSNFNMLKIEIVNETTAIISDDIEIELIDANFPNYKVVIPEYKTYMSFERKDLIQAVKEVETAANKSTHR
jgi:DNA polymerase-3 subunit beta